MTHKRFVGVRLLPLPNQNWISGPLLGRIDIHIEVPMVDYEKLSGDRMGETSEAIRARVQAARDIQTKRFSNYSSDIVCNADVRVREIRQCRLQDEGQSLMRVAMSQLNLSARAYHRTRSVKLARKIEDLVGVKKFYPCIWRRRCSRPYAKVRVD